MRVIVRVKHAHCYYGARLILVEHRVIHNSFLYLLEVETYTSSHSVSSNRAASGPVFCCIGLAVIVVHLLLM